MQSELLARFLIVQESHMPNIRRTVMQLLSTQKNAHLSSSGENLSNTSVIQLKISGFGTLPAHLPSRCHLIAQYDSVCEIRDTTEELFE